jgi:predicted nucleotide-binding protein
MIEEKDQFDRGIPAKLFFLKISREKAKDAINKQIIVGETIKKSYAAKYRARKQNNKFNFEVLRKDYKLEILSWDNYNYDLLRNIYTTDSIAIKYDNCVYSIEKVITDKKTNNELMSIYTDLLNRKLQELHSLFERLELYEIAPNFRNEKNLNTNIGSRVFIVHGHDEAIKQSVARYLEHLDISPIILSEKAGMGRGIIEKLEQESEVDYAIILLTPDDEGKLKSDSNLNPRARQNVIMELGYFIGRFSRSRVCAIKSGTIDLPTDYHGIEYIQFDDGGGWKLKLANELKSAGYDIDLNKLT